VPSAFDEIEERNRRQYLDEMRRDMGFSDSEIQQLNQSMGPSSTPEPQSPLPLDGPNDEGDSDSPQLEED